MQHAKANFIFATILLMLSLSASAEEPLWLNRLIAQLASQPVANPPATIYRYRVKNHVFYYTPPVCCDIPSTAYDEQGKIICHPEGGFTGRGDGRCPDFVSLEEKATLIWEDRRSFH